MFNLRNLNLPREGREQTVRMPCYHISHSQEIDIVAPVALEKAGLLGPDACLSRLVPYFSQFSGEGFLCGKAGEDFVGEERCLGAMRLHPAAISVF